ncbi:hypothetical protein [Asticcacaulis sp. EMRT-3]|uniref:hypothetical protein n=1 Tax=Asticcacaulis sp. EMRT-3 TaxID=3040349 RepID=UPI0024AE9B25|nr:hypothetical protein [Asticcacaulis sp. EMRT-3]MDI7776643.1 hypothetical protein [Asticcacaulis sp. EMRT-3]
MASLNSEQETPFYDFLTAVIARPDDHIRFLNLLSLLEHTGSRKIMLSQMKGILTQDILKHLAEETRHAFFFKREAEKLAMRPLEGYPPADTMCAGPGQLYFGRLDAGLTGGFPAKSHAEIGYLWVSLVVELRALWVYRLYQKALSAASYPLPLKGIIAEEDNHLISMVERLDELGFDTEAALAPACELEKHLFGKLFGHLRSAVL